jgi:hypothetical protein
MLASQLAMAELRKVTDNEVLLVFGASGAASKQVVERPESFNLISTALREYFKAAVRVRFVIDPTKNTPPAESGKKNNTQMDVAKLIESSPRLRRLLEKVDGEIIGVRKVE